MMPSARPTRLLAVWTALPALALALFALHAYLERDWATWSPGAFSLELCVVQRFGPLPTLDSSPIRSEAEGLVRREAQRAREEERLRRDAACAEELRARHVAPRRTSFRAASALALLAYLAFALRVSAALKSRPGSASAGAQPAPPPPLE